jgi:predicted dehydrogenase
MMKTKMIVVGLGHAWTQFYEKTLWGLEEFGLVELCGTVDPRLHNGAGDGTTGHPSFHASSVSNIPKDHWRGDVVVMILTPDHYPVIEELARMGFKKIMCEKPLVSRMSDMEQLRDLIDLHNLKIYAIDFYLPKTFGLQVALGFVGPKDPRYQWIRISNPDADFGKLLGDIEGAAVQVIEAGNFCLPDIAGRPYLAKDKEIGGMILDLVTHACGPLQQVGLLQEFEVSDVSLSRLSNVVSGHLVPVEDPSVEVEMYVNALLQADGMPIHLAFGKVPFDRGGLWALEIRGKNGMYYAGLRSGQPSILLNNHGESVTFNLNMTTYEFVVREALLYFEGALPGFDGNYEALSTSMEVGQAIIKNYADNLLRVNL